MTSPRLPYAPLRAALDRRAQRDLTVDAQAEVLGVTRRTIHRYATVGVELAQAERLACHAGLHPAAIWGDDANRWNHQALTAPEPARPQVPYLVRFLELNQCTWCLGWNDGQRRMAEQIAGRPARMRPCVCDRPVVATGQEPLDFGGAA